MKKSKQRIITLEQWAEVEVREGRTITTLYPPNAELRKKLEEMDPPPTLVYRRINFQSVVPHEYFWTTSDERRRSRGGHCIQRLTVENWQQASVREEFSHGQHLGRSGGVEPRPQERGGCDCPQCTDAQARLDGHAEYEEYDE